MTNEIQYFLMRVSRAQSSNTMQFESVGQLDNLEVESCRSAINKVTAYFASQSVLVGLAGNASDVMQSMNDLIKAYTDQPGLAEAIMEQANQQISRHFGNMCSLFRSYLDHFDKYFVDRHGKDSQNYLGWKKALANEYDNKLSYKLVYMMRNYIQHRDMPPMTMTIADSIENRKFEVRINVHLKEMRQDHDFSKKLKGAERDIDSISLRQVMEEFGASLT